MQTDKRAHQRRSIRRRRSARAQDVLSAGRQAESCARVCVGLRRYYLLHGRLSRRRYFLALTTFSGRLQIEREREREGELKERERERGPSRLCAYFRVRVRSTLAARALRRPRAKSQVQVPLSMLSKLDLDQMGEGVPGGALPLHPSRILDARSLLSRSLRLVHSLSRARNSDSS